MPQKTTMCSLDAISSVSRCMERNQGGCAVVVSNSTATFGVCLISRGRRHRLAGDVSPLKSFGKSAAVLNRELEIELAMHFLGVVKNEVSVVSIILCVASGFKPTSALDNLAKALMQHAEKYETAANLLHQHAKIASVGCEL
ncbi:hypothetical protein MHU86_20996 [Fragilaria crotonensis]|nr:hypothetical protein MHU86_20996 [Fragilaria crotonensis]